MTNNRTYKIIVGVATLFVTLFPFLVIAMFFFPFFLTFPAMATNTEPDPSAFAALFLVFPLMMCLGFLLLGMMVFYIIHIIKNQKGSEVIRILTAIGLYFLPYFAMPAYYLIYILPETPPDWALE